VVVAALIAGGAARAPTPQSSERAGRGSTVAGFSTKRLRWYSNEIAMKHVRKLAGSRGIGVRVRSKPGERAGAKYIRGKFEAFGYKTRVQKFSVDGGTSRNVIAWWPDARRYGLVVGAHMDTVPGSPGANDNASGVAVMLETARIAAGRAPVRFVRFVAFGSEEYGTNGKHHVGSRVYVNRLGKEGRRRLGGMISIDMIADGRPLITGTAGIGPEVVARTVFNKMRKKVGMSYQTLCDCSDNGPFERAEIPAAFLYSGNEPNYHDPSDKPHNLRKMDLKRTGRGMRLFFKQIDGDMIRRFRRMR
jgi:hypothetical protein